MPSDEFAHLQAKKAYDQRAMQAYKDYQATGLHITLEEFMDWVKRLETGTSKEIPHYHE